MIKDFPIQISSHLKFETTNKLIVRSKASMSKYQRQRRKLEEKLQKRKVDEVSFQLLSVEGASQKINYFILLSLLKLYN